jgi:hypothetical protein
LERIENNTFFSFVELNYGGIELEDLEKEYLIEIIKFREMEATSWLLEAMKQALIDQNAEKFDHFRNRLLRKISKMEKLLYL